MNKLAASLLVGVAGLFVSAAQAAPLTIGTPTVANDVENVRMVCNENGRCWRERSSRTVVIERNRDSAITTAPGVSVTVIIITTIMVGRASASMLPVSESGLVAVTAGNPIDLSRKGSQHCCGPFLDKHLENRLRIANK